MAQRSLRRTEPQGTKQYHDFSAGQALQQMLPSQQEVEKHRQMQALAEELHTNGDAFLAEDTRQHRLITGDRSILPAFYGAESSSHSSSSVATPTPAVAAQTSPSVIFVQPSTGAQPAAGNNDMLMLAMGQLLAQQQQQMAQSQAQASIPTPMYAPLPVSSQPQAPMLASMQTSPPAASTSVSPSTPTSPPASSFFIDNLLYIVIFVVLVLIITVALVVWSMQREKKGENGEDAGEKRESRRSRHHRKRNGGGGVGGDSSDEEEEEVDDAKHYHASRARSKMQAHTSEASDNLSQTHTPVLMVPNDTVQQWLRSTNMTGSQAPSQLSFQSEVDPFQTYDNE